MVMVMNKKVYRDVMSSISEVTVPQAVRSSVGISKEARWFAFMHPPVGLTAKLNLSCYVDDDYDDDDDNNNNDDMREESRDIFRR